MVLRIHSREGFGITEFNSENSALHFTTYTEGIVHHNTHWAGTGNERAYS
jgi:hypothetical protein